MLINEVEHIVGLSKKSIRYYEENGLLNPKRNSTNDYRIYSPEDIDKLKKIKFLRELGVPIRDLKLLNSGDMTLKDCMRDRIDKIGLEEEKYDKVKGMCLEIIEADDSFDSIDIKKYFQNINILRKEGFTMRNTHTSAKKKIFEAVVASIVFSILFIFLAGIITYFQFTEVEKMPWAIYIFIMIVFVVPILGMAINLVKRIKEINGGEEDEASKY